MSILGKIFSGGASDLVDGVGNAIDKIHTSAEEKELVKHEVNKAIFDFESNMQAEVTKRWEADMKSDSWLSKNVRPLTLIFLIVSTVLMIFVDAGVLAFEVDSDWKDLLKMVLITTVGAYFGGRSYEKVKK